MMLRQKLVRGCRDMEVREVNSMVADLIRHMKDWGWRADQIWAAFDSEFALRLLTRAFVVLPVTRRSSLAALAGLGG